MTTRKPTNTPPATAALPNTRNEQQSAAVGQPSRNPDQQSTDPSIQMGTVYLPPQPLSPPVLHREFGVWRLEFMGEQVILKHEIGLSYVAFLLDHPNEEFHGLALALKVRALRNGQSPDSVDLIQERALALDDAEAARRLYRKQLELEDIVDDPDQTDPVKEEAQRELLSIYAYQKSTASRTNTMAQKASDSVAKAIKRLHTRMAKAVDDGGKPKRTLRLFAEYIMTHILLPSGRGLEGGIRRQNSGGRFKHAPL